MKYFMLLFFLAAVLACNKENYFADQYQPTYNGYPFFASLFNQEVYGKMISKNEIIVYTGPYSLYTKDDFNTIEYTKYAIGNSSSVIGDVRYFDGVNCWIYISPNYNSNYSSATVLIHPKSERYFGFSQLTFPPAATPSYQLSPVVSFIDSTSVLLAGSDNRHTYLYKGDIKKNSASLISTISPSTLPSIGSFPSGVYAIGNVIFFLCNTATYSGSSVYNIYTTSDNTMWQGPYSFGMDRTEELVALTGNKNLMIARILSFANYQSTGKVSYRCTYSIDQGKTWAAFSGLPSNVIFAQILPDNSLYAVIDASGNGLYDVRKLAKSLDGGASWIIEDKLFYANEISFFDQMNGIATFQQILQITHDGGKTWKVALSNPR